MIKINRIARYIHITLLKTHEHNNRSEKKKNNTLCVHTELKHARIRLIKKQTRRNILYL